MDCRKSANSIVIFIIGFAKVFDYENSLAEMRAAGLNPDWFLIWPRHCFIRRIDLVFLIVIYALGAGALATFLFLTI
ncbi:hypothetical protein ACVXG7_16185 [Enterobacter hormaechei]